MSPLSLRKRPITPMRYGRRKALPSGVPRSYGSGAGRFQESQRDMEIVLLYHRPRPYSRPFGPVPRGIFASLPVPAQWPSIASGGQTAKFGIHNHCSGLPLGNQRYTKDRRLTRRTITCCLLALASLMAGCTAAEASPPRAVRTGRRSPCYPESTRNRRYSTLQLRYTPLFSRFSALLPVKRGTVGRISVCGV